MPAEDISALNVKFTSTGYKDVKDKLDDIQDRGRQIENDTITVRFDTQVERDVANIKNQTRNLERVANVNVTSTGIDGVAQNVALLQQRLDDLAGTYVVKVQSTGVSSTTQATVSLGNKAEETTDSFRGLNHTIRNVASNATALAERFRAVVFVMGTATAAAYAFSEALAAVGAGIAGIAVSVGLEAMRQRLRQSADSARELANMIDTVFQIANQSGTNIFGIGPTLAQGLNAGIAPETLKNLASAMTAYGLATEETAGVIKELIDLQGQLDTTVEDVVDTLDEFMPKSEAWEVLANAVGKTTEKLKELKDEPISGYLHDLSQMLVQTADGADTVTSEWNQLANAWARLMRTFNQSGAINAVIGVLNDLTDWLKSQQASQLIRQLAQDFVHFATVTLPSVVSSIQKNWNDIKRIFTVSLGAIIGFATGGAFGGILGIVGALTLLATEGSNKLTSFANDADKAFGKVKSDVSDLVDMLMKANRAILAIAATVATVRLGRFAKLPRSLVAGLAAAAGAGAYFAPEIADFLDGPENKSSTEKTVKSLEKINSRIEHLKSLIESTKQSDNMFATERLKIYNNTLDKLIAKRAKLQEQQKKAQQAGDGTLMLDEQKVTDTPLPSYLSPVSYSGLDTVAEAVNMFQYRQQQIAAHVGLSNDKAARLQQQNIRKYQQRLQQLSRQTQQTFGMLQQFAKQAARNIQNAFAQFLFKPLENGFEGLVQGFTRALRRMTANLLASRLFKMIGQWGASNQFSGGLIGGVASVVASALGTQSNVAGMAKAQSAWESKVPDMASNTGLWSSIGSAFAGWFADGGNIGPGQWGIAGESGPELVTGPATVTPMGGGDNVAYFNVEYHEAEGKTQQERQQDQQMFIEGLKNQWRQWSIEDVQQRGPVSKNWEKTYNFRRTGTT